MAADSDRDDPPLTLALVARVGNDDDRYNTLKLGHCYLYVQVMTDEMNGVFANTPYTIKGEHTGFTLKGTTDDEGILRHERVPDDHYEITCKGQTEPLELLFERYRSFHEERPWALRLRDVRGENR
jgi:hypothetical protein